MAQLTWRNVDAPNISGVTDALRLAGQSLTSGLTASREALEAFHKTTSQDESARALAATIGVSDPAKIKEILGGYNSSYLTPAAIEAISKRPQEAANLAQTQAQTTSTTIANDFNRENNPLRIEGARLDNAGKVISNAKSGVDLSKTIFDNDVARKQHEAAPAWNQELAQYRADRANPDPAAQARAATRAASPEFAARAAAAGITGEKLSTVLDKGEAAASNAVRLNSDFLKLDEQKRVAALGNTSRAMTESLIQAWGGPAGALRAAQEDPNMAPELKAEVVKQITAAAPNHRTPTESEILQGNAASAARTQAAPSQAAAPGNFIAYRNQGATRDKPLAPNLVQAMSFLPQLGISMEVTSGGQDGIETGSSKRTGSTRHDHGGAGDVRFMKDGRALSWENPQDIPTLQQIVKQARANGVTGIGAGPGYMNPTTTHIGFGSTAIWGAKGGKPYDALAEAVGNAPAGDRVQQILARAGQPLAAPDLRGPSGPVRQLGPAGGLTPSAPAVTPGVRLETPQDLSSNYTNVSSMLSSAATTSQMDAQLNPAAPIAEAFANPPEKSSTAMAVAAQLHKLGGDTKDGGIFSRSRLTIENINDAVQTVASEYRVTPDIAGALIQSAIKSTGSWVPILGSGGRKVDTDKLKTYVDRFVDKDGRPKTELVNMMAQKQAIEKQATDIKANLQAEREIWLQARGAAQKGNTRVDVQAADERYRNAQRAAEEMARKLGTNPNVLGNSRANTGR